MSAYTASRYNPNVSNPNVSNPNVSNPNVSNPNVSNPNVSNPSGQGSYNPNASNPSGQGSYNPSGQGSYNPNVSNPSGQGQGSYNPNVSNPNASNPSGQGSYNPNISNPNVSNPNASNPSGQDSYNPNVNFSNTYNPATQKLELIVSNKLNEWADNRDIQKTHSIDVTNFREENPILDIVPNGQNGLQQWLSLLPQYYTDEYNRSRLPFLPLQVQPDFEGLQGLRNYFTYIISELRDKPIIKEIAQFLENEYQSIYQQRRMEEEDQENEKERLQEMGLPDPELCVRKQRMIPRKSNIVNINEMKNKRGEFIFQPGDVDQLDKLQLIKNGRPIRNIIDLSPKRVGKTMEIIYAIAEYGFERIFKILTSRAWETRNEILEYLPGNTPPRQLVEINLEQMLYVPVLAQTETPCPICGNRNNSQLNLRFRSADEPSTTKYVCGNSRCRKVWFEEGG